MPGAPRVTASSAAWAAASVGQRPGAVRLWRTRCRGRRAGHSAARCRRCRACCSDGIFQRDHARNRRALGFAVIERIALPVRLRPRRVDEGDALRHHAPHAGRLRRRHQIARALDPQPRVLSRARRPPATDRSRPADRSIDGSRPRAWPPPPRAVSAAASNASTTTARAPSASIAATLPATASCRSPHGRRRAAAEQRPPDHAGRAGDEDIHRSHAPIRSRRRGVDLRGVVVFEELDRLAVGEAATRRPSASRPPCRSSCSARCSGRA